VTDEPDPLLDAPEEASQIARRVRQRHGLAAGALAGALMGMRDVLEGPPKESAPVVVASASEPTDIDADGLSVDMGEVEVASPALPIIDTTVKKRRRTRRTRRTD
jgi:hypothetical protein